VAQVRDEHAKLAAERLAQIETLTQTKLSLEQDKAALTEQRVKLEGEVRTQTQARDEQARVAAERQRQLTELQQQMQARESSQSELSARQQLMHEELVRAEAQIDLIKDLLLRDPGL